MDVGNNLDAFGRPFIFPQNDDTSTAAPVGISAKPVSVRKAKKEPPEITAEREREPNV